jgi:hypothetical protein
MTGAAADERPQPGRSVLVLPASQQSGVFTESINSISILPVTGDSID